MFGFFSKKKKPVKSTGKKKGAGDGAAAQTAAPAAAAQTSDTAKDKAKGKDKAPTLGAAEKTAAKPDSLKAAIAAMEEVAPVSAGAPLDRAKDTLEKRAAIPADRKQLIEQALAIQQTQAKMLDKLPEETRQKLRALAMKAFVIDETRDKKKLH